MNNCFENRVWAAAVAGWWAILIAWAALALAWLAYLGITSVRPAWLLSLCGPDVSWSELETISLWIIAVFKLCIWLAAFAATWLTLWSWRLHKGNGGT